MGLGHFCTTNNTLVSLFSDGTTAPPTTLDLTSNLLPVSFPTGDPSTYALPVFLLEPSNSYAARGKPAKLTCRAAHALTAHFVCNGDHAEDQSSKKGSDRNGTAFIEASVLVRRADVMDVLGEFSCKCVAESEKGKVESKEVTVTNACKYQS